MPLPSRLLTAVLTLACTARLAEAQTPVPRETEPPAGNCWRFSFGAWDPPLDWGRAGHPGAADSLARSVRRARDSVFARDSAATHSNAMLWTQTPRGWTLLLFPPWWPVGVEIRFARIRADDVEISGDAVALVGDAAQVASRARARATRCP